MRSFLLRSFAMLRSFRLQSFGDSGSTPIAPVRVVSHALSMVTVVDHATRVIAVTDRSSVGASASSN